MDCTYVLQLFIRESSLEYYSESVCQPQCMCSMALKNPPIFKWKNLRNVNSTLCFDFNILMCQSAITGIPERHTKEKVFFFIWGVPVLLREKYEPVRYDAYSGTPHSAIFQAKSFKMF